MEQSPFVVEFQGSDTLFAGVIFVGEGKLMLYAANQRKTKCRVCGCELGAGEGMRYRRPFHGQGYVCPTDARKFILQYAGPYGYALLFFDAIGPAYTGYSSGPMFTATQVADGLRKNGGKPNEVE